MFLQPNVRYELTDHTRLMFADVETEYMLEEDTQVSCIEFLIDHTLNDVIVCLLLQLPEYIAFLAHHSHS